MSLPQLRRSHALLAIVIAASFAVTGCASSLVPQSSAHPTSTPEPSESSTPEPSESDAPDDSENEFSDETLAQICIEATTSAFDTDVTFTTEDTRVEERTVEPRWLVLVPARTNGFDGEAQCTIGGSPASPIIEMATASVTPLPEDQIENLIDGRNDGGTE